MMTSVVFADNHSTKN